MKLVYCQDCQDLFKLSYAVRTCECGRVYGRYINNDEVEVSDDAVSIAIGNTHLRAAIEAMQIHTILTGNTAERTSYYQPEHGLIELAWVRPNCGPGNPRSRVVTYPESSESGF
jgi:hypothetical protein